MLEVPGGQDTNKYDDILKAEQDPARDALNLSRRASFGMDSAKAREVLRLNAQTGLPPSHLEKTLDPVYRDSLQDGLSANRYDAILKNAPSTAKWASDPFRLKAGQEDLERLSRVEGILRKQSAPAQRTDADFDAMARLNVKAEADKTWAEIQRARTNALPYAPSGPGLYAADFAMSYAQSRKDVEDLLASREAKRIKGDHRFITDDATLGMWERAGTALEMGLRHGAKTNESARLKHKYQAGERGPEIVDSIRDLERVLSATPKGSSFAAKWLYGPSVFLGQMLDMASVATKRGYQGAAAGAAAAAIGGQLGPQVAVPEEIVTVPAAGLFGGVTGFAAGIVEQAHILTSGNVYIDLDRVRGENGETIPEATKQAVATSVGVISAGLEVVGLGFLTAPLRGAAKKFLGEAAKEAATSKTAKAALGRFAVEYAKSVAGETGTEVLQEVAAVVGEEFAKEVTSGQFETFRNSPEYRAQVYERLLTVAADTLRATVVLGGAGSSAQLAGDLSSARDQKAVERAKAFHEELKGLEKEIKESELAKENLNEIEAVATTTAQDARTEPYWLPALAAEEYFTQKGLDPTAEIAAITGDRKAYEEAIPRDGDIQIPVEKYVSLSQGEHKAFFQDNLRRAPDEMTMEETKYVIAEQRAREKAVADQPAAAQQTEDQKVALDKVKVELARISEVIEHGLVEGGFKAEAKRMGAVARKIFQRLSERTGQGALDLFQQFPLTVRRGKSTPADGRSFSQPSPEEERTDAAFADLASRVYGGAAAPRQAIPFSKTPKVLQALGAKDLPVTIAAEVITKARQKHGLSVDVVKDLPRQLRDPLMVLESATEQDSFVVMVEHTSKDGDPVIVAVHLNRNEERYQVNSVRSVHPRSMREVGLWMENGLTRYVDSERVRGRLESAGLQLPGERTDPSKPKVLDKDDIVKFQPADGGGTRGRIVIGKASISIDLFEKADRSTFLHEIGHFYLEVIRDIVTKQDPANPNKSLSEDFQAIRDWLGVKEGEAITDEHHEKFARAFELYLRGGNAPSKALKRAFWHFKRWLNDIYRELKGYFDGIELTPQLRDVMDRMLASEEEIFQARMERGGTIFEGKGADILTPAQQKRLEAAQQEATQEAEERLMAPLMREITREEQADWKEERAKLREESLKDLQKQPVYRAIHALTTKDVGGVDGAAHKLNKKAVLEIFSDPQGNLPASLPKGITSADGVHPDAFADWFGFKDGYTLLHALAEAEDIGVVADRIADERMSTLYPRMTPSEIKEKASEALHGPKYAALKALEMELLAEILAEGAAGKKLVRDIAFYKPRIDIIEEEARRDIDTIKVSGLRPASYRAAGLRAAKEALAAIQKGDIAAAIDAKFREILNDARYRAAVERRDAVKDFLLDARKFGKKDEKLAKTRDIDLINAARAILAKWGIGRFKGEPSDFLGQLKAYSPQEYDAINEDVTQAIRDARPYKEATFAEFFKMKESVEALWEKAKSTRELVVAGKRVSFDEAKADIASDLEAIPADYANYKMRGTESLWKQIKVALLSLKALARRAEPWAAAMGKNFTKYIWDPINDAIVDYRSKRADVIRSYLEAVRARPEIFNRQRIESPELDGHVFENKAQLLATLLHSGNDSNLMKLIVGYKWGEWDPESETFDRTKWDAFTKRMQEEGILTKADYDFAQAVWDLNESIKPIAQRAHKEMFGRYFKEITANEVATKWGTYRGGYVPAVTDPSIVEDIAIRKEMEENAGFNAAYALPTTSKGFTIARSKGYAQPLYLDLRLVPKHIDEVLRFSYIQPRVNEVQRLLKDPEISRGISAHDPAVLRGMVIP